MTDFDHWKKAYQELWGSSGDRETTVAQLVETLSGMKVVKSGFGAGSTELIHGQAKKHGYEKGAADLTVIGTRIRLEVTGPLTASVDLTAPLWVRPDKLENARLHLDECDTWIVHCLERSQTIRVIRLDRAFFSSYDQCKFSIVNPTIRGNSETMVEIPFNDSVVQPFPALIDAIEQAKKPTNKER